MSLEKPHKEERANSELGKSEPCEMRTPFNMSEPYKERNPRAASEPRGERNPSH